MLRKTSRLLAWQWSFAVRHHRRHRLRLQTGLWVGVWLLFSDYTGFSGHQRPLRGLLAYLPAGWAKRAFFRGACKRGRRHRAYSGCCGGVFTVGHPCAFCLGSDRWPAARRCWQRFVPDVAKRTPAFGKRVFPGGVVCLGDGPAYPVA